MRHDICIGLYGAIDLRCVLLLHATGKGLTKMYWAARSGPSRKAVYFNPQVADMPKFEIGRLRVGGRFVVAWWLGSWWLGCEVGGRQVETAVGVVAPQQGTTSSRICGLLSTAQLSQRS